MKRFLIAISVIAIALSSCVNDTDKARKVTLEKDEIGVYSASGAAVYLYDKTLHQLSTSSTGFATRFQTDDQTGYVSLKFATKPVVGKDVKATLLVNGIANVESATDVSMRVLKIESGKIWVHYDNKKLGFVMAY